MLAHSDKRDFGPPNEHRRYLRARKWSPEEAYTQFAETENWRKENKLDELYKTIDVQDYEQSRRLVCLGPLCNSNLVDHTSIRNGQAVATNVVSLYMSLK